MRTFMFVLRHMQAISIAEAETVKERESEKQLFAVAIITIKLISLWFRSNPSWYCSNNNNAEEAKSRCNQKCVETSYTTIF